MKSQPEVYKIATRSQYQNNIKMIRIKSQNACCRFS